MRIKDKIINEINEKVPDLSSKIREKAAWQDIKERSMQSSSNKFYRSVKVRYALGVACALVIAITALLLFLPGVKENPVPVTADSYDIVLDVNPRIMLSINADGNVKGQRGLNEDGVVFLYNKNYTGISADEAIKAVMSEMQKLGILDNNAFIRISAFSEKNKTIDESKQSHAEKIINEISSVNTVFLSDEELEKIEEYYKSNSVKENERQIISDFKSKVLNLIHSKISDINYLMQELEKYNKKSDEIIIDFPEELRRKISDFVLKYNADFNFDLNGEIKYSDVEDLIEELEEGKKDLEDGLKDISESEADDDLGELFEDLIEIVKEEIFGLDD